MSDSYGTTGYGASGFGDGAATGAQSGTVDTAKQEAADVKDTAAKEAGNVVGTAKTEAKSVVREAKTQAKDLYAQSTRELKDQAATQQDRVAKGLRSVGDELQSMAGGAEEQGLAADLVQQASQRVSAAAAWLGDRDPGSLLDEVKSYARRKPGTFIAVAAIAGLAVGRLTRALAEGAKERSDAENATTGSDSEDYRFAAPVSTVDDPALNDPAVTGGFYEVDETIAVEDSPYGGTPLYDESRATRRTGDADARSGDVRPDSF